MQALRLFSNGIDILVKLCLDEARNIDAAFRLVVTLSRFKGLIRPSELHVAIQQEADLERGGVDLHGSAHPEDVSVKAPGLVLEATQVAIDEGAMREQRLHLEQVQPRVIEPAKVSQRTGQSGQRQGIQRIQFNDFFEIVLAFFK